MEKEDTIPTTMTGVAQVGKQIESVHSWSMSMHNVKEVERSSQDF